ncbi:DNA mismatch repair protein [Xylogone sp. PMI_703]|nr:DNA mismatch repair protein [Xylogone sp. PMI_703]
MPIQPLPPDVVAQIKSSTSITSLNGVVIELAKNSLDAGCTKIDVTVDYTRGGCVVEDDGIGIPPSEFGEDGGLGKPYHSSKYHDTELLYGGYGTFLSSLSALSFLSITSHHEMHHSYNTIQFNKSRVVSRITPSPVEYQFPYLKNGTRVTVRDLFGAMPVRVKQRVIEAEREKGNSKSWEKLKHRIIGLLLSWPSHVAMTIRNSENSQKIVIRPPGPNQLAKALPTAQPNLPYICSLLSQAQYISATEWSPWIMVGASTSKLNISGAISLQPSPSRRVQFLSLGIEPLPSTHGQNLLYDEVNQLFMNSSFGDEEEESLLNGLAQERRSKGSDGLDYTKKELRRSKKGVDRWPMFFIRINILHHLRTNGRSNVDSFLDSSGDILASVLELLKATILEFLSKHHFRPNYSLHNPLTTVSSHSQVTANLLPTVSHVELPESGGSRTESSDTKQPRLKQQMATKQGKVSLPRKRKFDQLGGNVQLPDFRRSSKSQSPFDAWSRVKSGTQMQKSLSEPSNRQLPEGRSSLRHNVDFGLRQRKIKTSEPLVCESGRISRPPFDDVLSKGYRKTENDCDRDEIGDWLDPITRVKSAVNLRTGHIISSDLPKRLSQQNLASFRAVSDFDSPIPSLDRPLSPWVSNILTKWENPVFKPTDRPIQRSYNTDRCQNRPHTYCAGYSEADLEQAFQEHSSGMCGKISKSSLRSAEVISQVDKKFILIKITAMNASSSKDGLLVLVDQHAADERIRIEELMVEFCKPRDAGGLGIQCLLLDQPMVFEVLQLEGDILLSQQQYFADWGIQYDILSDPLANKNGPHIRLVVRSLPPSVTERYRLDPKLLINHIRAEAWKKHEGRTRPANTIDNVYKFSELEMAPSWVRRIHDCPQSLIDVLNSRSCRSAIMFNDELSHDQCKVLLNRLADCAFPFQCAHGRPSMVPLLDLEGVRMDTASEEYPGSGSFGKYLSHWKESFP